MSAFVALEAMGITVREMARLGDDALFYPMRRKLLVDAELSQAERERVACRTLGILATPAR
ncbi:MAG: hypothetical protein QM714_00415 [Nocardioides sp.]|uniref:hypothetical protein n=1 Tax=Nocardioides sp. TaxID=35761 RepID=UPI0039E2A40E